MSSLNNRYYGYKLNNENNKKWFNVFHRIAPLIRWTSFILLLIAPFRGWTYLYLFIGFFAISFILNNIKWKFLMCYEYILFGNILKVIKTYNEFRKKEIIRFDFNNIKECKTITPDEIPDKGAVIAFYKAYPLELILNIELRNQKKIILTADKYLYGVIMDTLEKVDNKNDIL